MKESYGIRRSLGGVGVDVLGVVSPSLVSVEQIDHLMALESEAARVRLEHFENLKLERVRWSGMARLPSLAPSLPVRAAGDLPRAVVGNPLGAQVLS